MTAVTVGLIAVAPSEAVLPASADVVDESDLGPTAQIARLTTATSNTVRESDGTFTTTEYTEPINYQDSTGKWSPIDSRGRARGRL